MKKRFKNSNKELEDTLVDSDFNIPLLTKLDFESSQKIISFISEFMSLSLNEKIAHYLINKKIRAAKNPLTSDTLFHYLCINDDNLPLIKLMNPNVDEIEKKNNLGQRLLHIAVQNNCIKIAKYLIENKADINSKDDKNNTLLHISVKNEDFNMVKLLVKYNVRINEYNNNNETPIDIAIKKKNKLIINYLENKINNIKNNLILYNKDIYKDNLILTRGRNTIDKSNLKKIQNSSINIYSDETKNDTENHSLNVYRKKVVAKIIKTPLMKEINFNRGINFNLNLNKKGNTPNKKMPNKYIFESGLIYRKNSPRIINKRKSFKEIINRDKYRNIELNLWDISPKLNIKNTDNLRYNPKNQLNIRTQINQKQNQIKSNINKKNKPKSKNLVLKNNIYNSNYNSLFHQTKEEYNKMRTRNQKKLGIYNTYDNPEENKIKNKDKEKLTEFLKEIGMQHYSDLLISEGFDDIDLIIKQMNIGFPSLYDTLKEIGIISPGDRAKILVHVQEISNGFNFEFPFEQVYFKNNRSIHRWLNKEGLSKFINNFIDAGYQSFELLLIQMASKYKINEKILKEELFIFNEEDLKKILKSLETNSEKYINQLKKNHNVQRTYSKMVNNYNSESFCTII